MKKIILIILIISYPISVLSQDTLIWKKRIIQLGVVKTLAVNPQENMIAHNVNNLIHLRDTSGNYIIDIDFSENNITAIEFSSNDLLYFASFEKSTKSVVIFAWNIESQEIIDIFEPEPISGYEDVIDISLSEDNSKLGVIFTFNKDGNINYKLIIWDIHSLQIIINQDFESLSKINKMEFSEKKVFFDLDNEIVYFDLNDNNLNKPFEQDPLLPKSEIKDFAINENGDKVATVDYDGVCDIWDIKSNFIINSFIPIENTTKLSLVEWGRSDDYLIFADNSKHYITKYGFDEQSIINSFVESDSVIFDFKISKDKERLYFCDGINIYKLKLDYRKAIGVKDDITTNIKFYPNPVQNILHFENPDNSILKIFVYDLLGNQILEKVFSSSKGNIDFSTFPMGYYLIKFQYNNQSYFDKVIKN